MTVTYAPPLRGGPPDDRIVQEVIETGPAYVRTRGMTRWHRVRSGRRWIAEYRPDELRESWYLWCGQHVGSYTGPLFSDDPPRGEPRCGTCEGRAIGVDPSSPEWLFTPRTLDPPKVCPGSGDTRFVQELTYNRGICHVCMKPVKIRALGGPYYSRVGAQRHAPGLDLVGACPFHGWRDLTVHTDGRVMCRCQATGSTPRPKETP